MRNKELKTADGASDQAAAYLATARSSKSERARLDVLCADDRAVAALRDTFSTDLALNVRQLEGGPTAPGEWQGVYSADVLIGTVEAFAIDYMYESLHAEEIVVGVVARRFLLVDVPELLIGDRGHWSVDIRVADNKRLDRLLYVDFVRLYERVAGICTTPPSELLVQRCRALGIQVTPTSTRALGASGAERRDQWRHDVRNEAAAVEFRQRTSLVDERREMVKLSGSPDGIERLVMRSIELSPRVRRREAERDAVYRTLDIPQNSAEALGGPLTSAAIKACVLRIASNRGVDAVLDAARVTALRVHAPLWMQHLIDMDTLAREFSRPKEGATFDAYIEEAYDAFNRLRADALISWTAWLVS